MTHLTEEQTRALARRFAVEVRHLEKCAECRAHLRQVAAEEDGAYRAAMIRATEGTLRRIPAVRAEKAAAPALLTELLAMPEAERETALASDGRFHSYALASYILKRCETEIPRDPGQGRVLAGLARGVTGLVDPRSCGGTAALADLEAYSFAIEGEALRVSGDPEQALRAFAESRLHQERGGPIRTSRRASTSWKRSCAAISDRCSRPSTCSTGPPRRSWRSRSTTSSPGS